MKRNIRGGTLTGPEKVELWNRWKRGESLSDIGRAMSRYPTDVFKQLSPSGGIRPVSRCWSAQALTLVEREEISRGIVAGQSIRSIASFLNRSASTISRELNRNGGIQDT